MRETWALEMKATRQDLLARMLGKERASRGTVYIPSSRAAILYELKNRLCKPRPEGWRRAHRAASITGRPCQ